MKRFIFGFITGVGVTAPLLYVAFRKKLKKTGSQIIGPFTKDQLMEMGWCIDMLPSEEGQPPTDPDEEKGGLKKNEVEYANFIDDNGDHIRCTISSIIEDEALNINSEGVISDEQTS